MKSVVELDIDAPRDVVARLFADPRNMQEWMDDMTIEPVSGEPGAVGSRYRLIPSSGEPPFEATVTARNLPRQTRLRLERPPLRMEIADTFEELPAERTRLVSVEVFRFEGLKAKLGGLLGRRAIKKAHRRHMKAFKRFAERAA